jgi:hypothetical protein
MWGRSALAFCEMSVRSIVSGFEFARNGPPQGDLDEQPGENALSLVQSDRLPSLLCAALVNPWATGRPRRLIGLDLFQHVIITPRLAQALEAQCEHRTRRFAGIEVNDASL